MKTDTIAATAIGMSNLGTGIVRISGEGASSVIDSILRNRKGERVGLGLVRSHTVHYEYIYDGDKEVDEASVVTVRGSHSYIAESTVEIDCHGGVLMVRRILETVSHTGARTAEPGESTKRAFLDGRLDLSQAKVVADVIHVTNEYALKGLVGQLNGSVSNKIKELHSQILYQIAFIESALDDPEHIPLDGYGSQLMGAPAPTVDEARKLPLSADDSRFMFGGVETVILGKLNVGKSSLTNAPLGKERVIIAEVAGTARDTPEEHIHLQGTSLNVVDTAGIRDTGDMVEKTDVDQALKAARDADSIIYVVDGFRSLDENDREIMDSIRGRKTTVLLNKSGLDLEVGTEELEQLCGHKMIPISIEEEQGVELLEQEIKKLFYHGDLSSNDQVYITSVCHKEVLEQCLESLLMVRGSVEDDMSKDFYSIDLMNTYERLGFIIGESTNGDIVSEIFAESCMSKQGNLVWKRNVE